MVTIEFEYNNKITNIKANISDIINDITKKFFLNEKIDSDSVELLHNGKMVDIKEKVETLMDEPDKKSDIIEHKNENQLIDEKSIDSEESKKILAFLINILYIKRDYILDKSKLFSNNDNYFNEKISFLSSKYGKINLSNSKLDITIKQTLDIINSVLIKCMIKLQKNYRDIQSILDNKSINFQIFDDFLQDKFFLDEKNKNLDETKFIMAYINEKKENYEEALKVWKYFGTRNIPNDKYLLVGRERTKKIFFKFKENKTINSETKQALFRKYISWLLLKYQNEAFEIMLKTEIVNVKVFLDEIIPEIEKEKGESGSLKEKFLEYCNQYNKNFSFKDPDSPCKVFSLFISFFSFGI